ncbi:MAG: methionine--tRNA ligase [Candidatus Micrarchaeia archaeon]
MKYIVTSALPYAEGMPHLGNLVGSILPADVFYKFLLMKGEDAIFICGSDEHGTPIELQAIKQKIAPEEFAESMHRQIKKALEDFECTFTYYGKTHTEQNKKVVYEIFEALDKNGYIIKVDSEQAYCNNEKRFLSDTFIEGTCPHCGYEHARGDQCENCGALLTPKELVNPHCRVCGSSDITFNKTTNLAIDLPKLQGKIKDFIERNSKNDWSKNAINHSLNYIKRGLNAREITRDLKWGFPVPVKGFEDKVFYVWFDAPIGYIGITREWSEEKWLGYWKDDSSRLVQFMGKDNIEFHALFWPGMLIGSDVGYVLPSTIYAYEYLLARGMKFSKSRGVGLNISNAIKVMEPDYWRFVLMYLLPETADSEFSVELVRSIVNGELNNVIGNFVHRTLSIAKGIGIVPSVELSETAKKVIEEVKKEEEEYLDNFNHIRIREALRNVIQIAAKGNGYISSSEPWHAKGKELDEIMYVALSIVKKIGVLIYPFTPSASARILEVFGMTGVGAPSINDAKIEAGARIMIGTPKPLFRKFTDKDAEEIEKIGGGNRKQS